MKRIALLWIEDSLGLYGNRGFDELFRAVGENSGNLAFVHAIRHQIEGIAAVLPWSVRKQAVEPFDLLVMPAANQIGPHVDLGGLADHWAHLGKPIVAIGLGAQSPSLEKDTRVPDGSVRWLQVLDRLRPGSAPNIWTRGPYSAAQVARFGIADAVIGNCPTHFINHAPDLGQRIHKAWTANPVPRAVAVAAGYQHWAEASPVEQQLVALMQDPVHPGEYITQSAADMLRLARPDFFDAIPPEQLKAIRAYAVPHLTEAELRIWARRHARAYYDVPAWMDALARHDLTIGPRYHGTALALQAERMGVTIAIDSRTEEMCVQTGVPFFRAQALADKPLTRTTLKRLVRFDPEAYDARRAERAAAYVAFLEANGLTPRDHLKRIAARA